MDTIKLPAIQATCGHCEAAMQPLTKDYFEEEKDDFLLPVKCQKCGCAGLLSIRFAGNADEHHFVQETPND